MGPQWVSSAPIRHDGSGTFTDVGAESGVDHDAWSASAAFVDYDHDGDLDLYVANYLDWFLDRDLPCYNDRGELDYCGPVSYDAPAPDVLYRNNGDGTFTDVSDEALRVYTQNGFVLKEIGAPAVRAALTVMPANSPR